jgi:radical SAM protein with 4Fe4S-binding SPASM domain
MAFSGGEHLLREDSLEILEYTANAGLWSFINTNAKLLNRKKLREIKQITNGKVIFVFSLNSIENKVNKWSRDDSLRTVRKTAKMCHDEGVNFFFIITVSKSNLQTLKKTVALAKSFGIPVLRSPFVMRGRGKNFPELKFTKEDMEEIVHPVLSDYPLSYVSYTPYFASPEFVQKMCDDLKVALGQLGCQAGKGFVGINAEGDVAPCVQLLDNKIKCGNVRETPLAEIIRNNEIINELRSRKNLQGKCGRCRYKHTCGGCRATAFYHSGDYLAEDPTCFFEPEDETTVSAFEDMQNANTQIFIDFIKNNEPYKSFF